jgi:hypothetical protein
MWRLAAVVLMLIAVAVVCVPKVGSEATPDMEVQLCAASLHGSACECADVSHDMPAQIEAELVDAYHFDMTTNLKTTTREIRRPLRCIGLDERASAMARCSNGDLSGPRRVGRLHGA